MSLKDLVALYALGLAEAKIAETLATRITPKRRAQVVGYLREAADEMEGNDNAAAAHTISLLLEGIRR